MEDHSAMKYSRLALLVSMGVSLGILGGCAVVPEGPSVMALPGTGKSFDQFRADDGSCRQFAFGQVGGVTTNQAATNSAVGSAVVGTALGAAAGAAFNGGTGGALGAGVGVLAGGGFWAARRVRRSMAGRVPPWVRVSGCWLGVRLVRLPRRVRLMTCSAAMTTRI